MSFASEVSATDNWRDVSLTAGARAISLGGDFLAATALVLAFQQRGDSGYGVAALLLASTVPIVVLGRLGGRLADRFDSRRLLTAVEGAARDRGLTTLRLDTRGDLTEARALYAACGYREVEARERRRFADHWFVKDLRLG